MKYGWFVPVVVSIGVVFMSSGLTKEPHFSAGSHHPVGVLYVKVEAEKPRKFHPPGTLPKDIGLDWLRDMSQCRFKREVHAYYEQLGKQTVSGMPHQIINKGTFLD